MHEIHENHRHALIRFEDKRIYGQNSELPGKSFTYIGCDSSRFGCFAVDHNPDGFCPDQQVIAPPDLGMALAGDGLPIANPGRRGYFFPGKSGQFVVDLMPRDPPAKHPPDILGRARDPVRYRNILNPLQIHDIVDMALLIDIIRLDGEAMREFHSSQYNKFL